MWRHICTGCPDGVSTRHKLLFTFGITWPLCQIPSVQTILHFYFSYIDITFIAGRNIGSCNLKSGIVNRSHAFHSGKLSAVCGLRIERQEQDSAFVRLEDLVLEPLESSEPSELTS